MLAIGKYWKNGRLDKENNVCFGEGGAGLFSDGKLITRIKSPYVQYVMDKLVTFGAPPEIAYQSNPHLGSNKIRQLISQLTQELLENKNEIYYNTKIKKLLFEGQKVVGIETVNGNKYYSPYVILATGHSATEMYHHLAEKNVMLRPKDFSVGVRIEHSRRLINRSQHGEFSEDEALGASRYRLSWKNPESKKGVYSFCMCPGGYILSSGTEDEGIVTNGMSNYAHNSPWSNAALVVNVKAGEDFSTNQILNGLDFQRSIEHSAYLHSKEYASGKELPAQTVTDFMDNSFSTFLPKTSCPSGIISCNLIDIFPSFIIDNLREGIINFAKRVENFISYDAVLLAPETRTSSPITICRNPESLESYSHRGLYPCGEGAGYAGGITSSAVDGVKVAMAILKDHVE